MSSGSLKPYHPSFVVMVPYALWCYHGVGVTEPISLVLLFSWFFFRITKTLVLCCAEYHMHICMVWWCRSNIWLWLKASTSTFAKWEPSQMKKNNEQCVDNKKSSRVFDMKFMTTWARFLSPILKPKSLGIFPPSHLIIFYLHSKWLWSQVTWQNPKWLRLLTWRYLGLLYHRYLYFVSF